MSSIEKLQDIGSLIENMNQLRDSLNTKIIDYKNELLKTAKNVLIENISAQRAYITFLGNSYFELEFNNKRTQELVSKILKMHHMYDSYRNIEIEYFTLVQNDRVLRVRKCDCFALIKKYNLIFSEADLETMKNFIDKK